MSQLPKIIIVHGFSGHKDEHWFPWLKKELIQKGHQVWCETLPDAETPDCGVWSEIIHTELEPNCIVIGHSLGSPAVMRALEKYDQEPIQAFFSIAGFARPLPHLSFHLLLESFVSESFDFERIMKNVCSIHIWQSDDDPYIPLGEATHLREQLVGSKLRVFEKRAHLGSWKNPAKFEELLVEVLRLSIF
jgi:predicted alpha/beta hydrolase family esterase